MQRIYTKDLSFESPATPEVFKKQWQPQVNVDLNTKSDKIDEEGNFEVVLTITITAKIEEQTAFLIEVQQAGIFFITGFEGEDLRRILGTAAPNILFPYARESIDTVCVKGGFPRVMLAPVNFRCAVPAGAGPGRRRCEAAHTRLAGCLARGCPFLCLRSKAAYSARESPAGAGPRRRQAPRIAQVEAAAVRLHGNADACAGARLARIPRAGRGFPGRTGWHRPPGSSPR